VDTDVGEAGTEPGLHEGADLVRERPLGIRASRARRGRSSRRAAHHLAGEAVGGDLVVQDRAGHERPGDGRQQGRGGEGSRARHWGISNRCEEHLAETKR
jgi:hypothetical protein